MIQDNENVYDEQIAPLMERILTICKEHEIPVVASFEYAPDSFCTSHLPFEGENERFPAATALLMRGTSRNPMMVNTRDAEGKLTSSTVIL